MNQSQRLHDIYDRVAKRCISLSAKCTVNLINGLYGTDYPPDSEVIYNWTEHEDDRLKRTLADTIVTINRRYSYHVEFTMTKEGDIVLRVIEYGFHHAMKTTDLNTIQFPEPMILYLYNEEILPDEYVLKIQFGTQGCFMYKVPVYKYLEKSKEELNNKKMIVLLPFQLLRLRKEIEKKRTPEDVEALKKLISHDIIDTLEQNVSVGNITRVEALKLHRMIQQLYHHIYDGYAELEEAGVEQMVEEPLIFDVDILEDKIEKLEGRIQLLEEMSQSLEANNQLLEGKRQSLESENQSLESENQLLESEKQSLESEKQSLESENQSLTRANTVWRLLARGLSEGEIARKTGLSADEIRNIIESE